MELVGGGLGVGASAQVTSPEVKVEMSKVKMVSAESATIEAVAGARVAASIEPERPARDLAGRTVREAKSVPARAHGISRFSIHPDGGDAHRLPRFARWIRVVVGRPEGGRP